jgi:hypothetical protein
MAMRRYETVASQRGQEPLNMATTKSTLLGAVTRIQLEKTN